MKKLLLLGSFIFSNFLYAADSLEGYWSNASLNITFPDGSSIRSLQTKELEEADIDASKYVVKVTQVDYDGGFREFESIKTTFMTPEDGEFIVSHCDELGGELGEGKIVGGSLDICLFKRGNGEEISYAAVPFGIYFFKGSVPFELPSGEVIKVRVEETLTSFGKN